MSIQSVPSRRASAYRILEDSLNLRDVRIYDTVEDADGKEKRVLNAKETTLAAQKQQALRDEFKDWIWRDPQRRRALVKQYKGVAAVEDVGDGVDLMGLQLDLRVDAEI